MSKTKAALWTPQFIVMSAINFLLIVIFYLLMVTIGKFAISEYGATTSQVGLVTGIYIIGTLLGRLFTGRVIEQIGRKRVLLFGLLFFTATTGLYFIHAGIILLLVCRLVHGIGVGVASTATGTIVAQILPPSRKGEGIGYFAMSATLGTAIGPFIGLSMVQHTTYSVIFMMCMIIGIISFLLAVFTKVPGAESTTVVQPTEKSKGSFISQYIELKAMPIAIVTFLMCFGYAAILSFISLFAKERNLEVASSYFFIVYAIAVLLTRPVTGKMLDRFGGNSVMYPCFIFFGTGLILMSFAHSAFILLLAGILIGIGYGNLSSGAQALAIKLTPPQRMGLATSTYFIALDAGLGVGPYLLGYVIPVFGYSVLYTSLGIFIFVLILLYYVVYGKRERMLKVSQSS